MSKATPAKSIELPQRGLGLVELMIALGLLAALMAGMVQLFVSNSQNASATAYIARIEETGRIALQMLNSDIRRAGFYGGKISTTVGNRSITGSLGEVCLSDDSSCSTASAPVAASTCVATTTSWARMLGQPLFGLNDTTAGYPCIVNEEYLRGDVLTVRYTPAQPATTLVGTKPYLRAALFDGKIFAGADEADAANDVPDQTKQIYELTAYTYFVGPSGRSCNGIDTPSLWRKAINDNGLPVSEELLAGVEHLQFKFLAGNQYVDANDITDWTTVASVEISVLVRSECAETGFVNDRTFAMGDLAAAYGPADGFRRQLFVGIATLRN